MKAPNKFRLRSYFLDKQPSITFCLASIFVIFTDTLGMPSIIIPFPCRSRGAAAIVHTI